MEPAKKILILFLDQSFKTNFAMRPELTIYARLKNRVVRGFLIIRNRIKSSRVTLTQELLSDRAI